jgi:hypothetical protein
MIWAGHTAHMGQRSSCRISVREPEGKRPLRISRPRCEDNIKMDLTDIELSVDCIHLAQDSDELRVLVNRLMKLRVP